MIPGSDGWKPVPASLNRNSRSGAKIFPGHPRVMIVSYRNWAGKNVCIHIMSEFI